MTLPFLSTYRLHPQTPYTFLDLHAAHAVRFPVTAMHYAASTHVSISCVCDELVPTMPKVQDGAAYVASDGNSTSSAAPPTSQETELAGSRQRKSFSEISPVFRRVSAAATRRALPAHSGPSATGRGSLIA